MSTFDYYRIFYYVASCHSFTKAAQVLNNSQPNIMRYINNLETELQCQLFVRGNHGVTLTSSGEKLLEHVSIAMEQIKIGEEEIRREQALESGLITIGVSEIALRLVLLPALERFRENYPGIHTHISNHSTPEAIHSLQNGLVDFSIVTAPLTIKKPLKKIPLTSFREILIGGAKYKALSQTTQSLASLNDAPFISLRHGTRTHEFYLQYFMNQGLHFTPELEAATTDQILPMIQHNLGIGFYPELLVQHEIQEASVFPIPLQQSVPEREICLVIDETRPLKKASEALIHELMDK